MFVLCLNHCQHSKTKRISLQPDDHSICYFLFSNKLKQNIKERLVGGFSPPLWKIWVRQLGWWHKPNISGTIQNSWQPVTTNQKMPGDDYNISLSFPGHLLKLELWHFTQQNAAIWGLIPLYIQLFNHHSRSPLVSSPFSPKFIPFCIPSNFPVFSIPILCSQQKIQVLVESMMVIPCWFQILGSKKNSHWVSHRYYHFCWLNHGIFVPWFFSWFCQREDPTSDPATRVDRLVEDLKRRPPATVEISVGTSSMDRIWAVHRGKSMEIPF